MGDTLDQTGVARLRTLVGTGIDGLGDAVVDVDRVAAHVLSPRIEGDVADLGLTGAAIVAPRLVPLPTTYLLDVTAFENALRTELSGTVAGCAYELRRAGQTVFSGTVQDARMADDPTQGPAVSWTTRTRMHLASCSKLITAIALTRVLAEHGISPDSPIAPYLPGYWTRGPNTGQITFAHLMNHTSGLGTAGMSASDFPLMKDRIAGGVAAPGTSYLYQNLNFGLCRILVATINGDIAPGVDVGLGLNDVVWDSTTIDAYVRYVETMVLAPAGVSGPGFVCLAGYAFGYPFPRALPGWDDGDLRSWSGGVGWHLSVDELLRVMGTVRRAGTILSPAAAQTMLDRRFGVDAPIPTRGGTVHEKTGWWLGGARTQQSMALFLPEDMELVVLANSGQGAARVNVVGRVGTLYNEYLRPQYHFPTDPTVVPAWVYGIEPDGDLLWYRHDGAESGGGIATWRGPSVVGVGWGQATHVFPGGGDVLYAIDPEGRLWWYEHKGFNTGAGLETPDSWAGPRQVGEGWGGVARVFSGGDGVIYVVDTAGKLIWYRHNAVATGEGLETPGSWSGPHEVGVGWDSALHVFSTGGGVIYAVMPDGTLRWYRHAGFGDGRGLESPGSWVGPVDVGSGWGDVTHVFSRGDGVIYAVMPDGTLRWFRHDGFASGAVQWRGPVEVGTGWDAFTTVFALLPRTPAPLH